MITRLGPIAGMVVVAGLSACGPIPVEQAERACLQDARLAQGPRGTVAMGVGVDGGGARPVGRVELEVSSDYLMGRDPAVVYQNCVMRKSGQMPTRPLHDLPGRAS